MDANTQMLAMFWQNARMMVEKGPVKNAYQCIFSTAPAILTSQNGRLRAGYWARRGAPGTAPFTLPLPRNAISLF